jgi:CHASE3 domain sensor protein
MRVYFEKRIVITFCLATIILCAVGIFSFVNIQRLMETARLLSHAMQVVNKGEEIVKSSVDSETAIRGYIITFDSSYLEPNYQSYRSLPGLMHEFNSLVQGYPGHIDYLIEDEPTNRKS